MTLAMALYGTMAGILMTLGLAAWDALTAGAQPYGLRTGLIGVTAGGFALVTAFGMAVTAYRLASRNRAPAGRKRLLAAAIFAGCAGMAAGTAAAALWLAAGHPWVR